MMQMIIRTKIKYLWISCTSLRECGVYIFYECFHYLFIFYAVNPLFYLGYEYSSFIIINNKRDQNFCILIAKVKLYITCTIFRRYVQIIHGIMLVKIFNKWKKFLFHFFNFYDSLKFKICIRVVSIQNILKIIEKFRKIFHFSSINSIHKLGQIYIDLDDCSLSKKNGWTWKKKIKLIKQKLADIFWSSRM